MGQSTTPKALALGVSLSLACGLLPGAAFAEESSADDTTSNTADAAPSGDAAKPDGYDKADFYSEAASPLMARSFASPLSSSLQPVSLSDEMKYFARYESNQNYDQGLSWGDSYHAMGYYQFDNRYSLKSFIVACYNYDPVKYSMFGWVVDADISGDLYDWGAGKLTSTGQQLNDSWHAAYNADSEEFSALQDSYAYNSYYLPAESYLASRGIDISNRADCVKGLCWGLANLFGTSGWHKFVGGWSDGYVDGTYYTSYDFKGAGLTNDMTDEEFVTTLCDYVVAHVGEFYKGQPLYHEGWQNRYKQEKDTCLAYLANKPAVTPPAVDTTPPADEPDDSGDDETEEPTEKPVEKPTEKPQDPEVTPPTNGTDDPDDGTDNTLPPESNGGLDGSGSGDQNDATETPKPSEPTETPDDNKKDETVTPPVDGTIDTSNKTEEPKKEVVDETTTTLEEPTTTTTQQPRDLPTPENATASDNEQQGTSKTSSLTKTGDDTLRGPLGVALTAAGVAVIAGAALTTRRIIK